MALENGDLERRKGSEALLRFPTEIVELITPHIDSSDLIRLWLCGSPPLVHRFMSGGVRNIRHVYLWKGRKRRRIVLPRLLSFFPTLETLTIVVESHMSPFIYDHMESLELDLESLKRLPVALESLSLVFSKGTPTNPPNIDLLDLLQTLPNLKHIYGIATHKVMATEPLFCNVASRLTCLETHAWYMEPSLLELCTSLEELHISGYVYAPCLIEGRTMKFPSSLTKLALGGNLKIDLGLGLYDSMRKYGMRTLKVIPEWPEGLQVLEVNGLWATVLFNVPDLFASSLPSGLLHFKTHSEVTIPAAFMAHLPKSLTALESPRRWFEWPSAESGGPTASLPRSLRLLKCRGSSSICDSDIKLLPRDLVAVRLVPSAVFNPKSLENVADENNDHGEEETILPPNLTDLSLEEVPWRCTISGLPPTLRTLSVSTMHPIYTIKEFPQELVTVKLRFGSMQPTNLTLSLLPTTLHTLVLDHREKPLPSDWTDSLPRNLKILHVHGAMSDKSVLHLPRTLTVLSIQSYSSSHSLSTSCLEHLPSTLTSLELMMAHLDVQLLTNLPHQCVQALLHSLSHGEPAVAMPLNIEDQLPKKLRYLFVDCALTNEKEAVDSLLPIQLDYYGSNL